ncbi:pseudouridine synthase [Planctomycetes bacterium K23_9]|uniref:Pseudouridine synthase n=1 Tax=Stieleria marina TaxID=1930275 RepID=A0A517NYR8_9BACT|nr:Ribosomal large subunit pseudouridine synthase B [Planctomycetes bacterium K23_9]
MPKRSTNKQASQKQSGSSRRKKAAPKIEKPEGPQRLQRVLAAAGFGSRRQCEELVETGRVAVDGEIASKLGTTVDPKLVKIHVDGVLLRAQKKVYYAVNKPTGVVTTNRDPHGRPRVIDLVPKTERIFPVGRLDRSSEGLILLTNDGDLAQMLAHPKFGVRKIYRVTVAGKVESETMRNMRTGIYIAEGHVKVEGAKIIKAKSKVTELEITLREGKNREIRRILARLGHKVQTLRRIAIGPLRLGDVPPGAYRLVSKEEVRKLHAAAEASRNEGETRLAARKVPRKKGAGASKRAAQRSNYESRSSSPSTNRPAAKRPAKRSKKDASSDVKFEFDFDSGSNDAEGSVIGGDPSESRKRPQRGRQTAKRTAGKRSSTSRSATTGTGKKRVAAKGKRKTTAKKKPAASATSQRRGAARVKKAAPSKGRPVKGRSAKKSVGRKRKR